MIHATKSDRLLASLAPAAWRERYEVELPDKSHLAFGALVGVVEVVDCIRVEEIVSDHPGRRWAEGPWCWVLANSRPFAEPIPHRGYQRLFRVPEQMQFNDSVLRSR